MARPATLLAESSREEKYEARGSVLLAAPLRASDHRIAGVLAVIGPTRLNYGRIVPMVEIEVGIDEIFAVSMVQSV